MKLAEKLQLAGVIIGLGLLTLGFLNLVLNLEIDSPLSFHIKTIYVLIYLIFIVLGVIMFKVYANGKKEQIRKRKVNKIKGSK